MKSRTIAIAIIILISSIFIFQTSEATSFPTIELANGGSHTGLGHDILLPSSGGISSGDLLLTTICVRSTNTLTDTPTRFGIDIPGWSLLGDIAVGGGNPRIRMWGKIANSTEFTNYTITSSSSEDIVFQSFRVIGHRGTLTSTTISFAGSATGDPPFNNPSGWDIENTLWVIGLCMIAMPSPAGSTSITPPSGYTIVRSDFLDTAGSDWSGTSAQRHNAVNSENPGVFSVTPTASSTASYTLAIRPQEDPALVTLSASQITYNRANLNGRLDSLFSSSVNLSFEWGDTASLGNNSSSIFVSSTGQYSIRIFNLESNTTYYFRAHSIEIPSGYESFGSILSFTTDETPPVLLHLTNALYILGFITLVVLFFIMIFWLRKRREGAL